MSKPYLAEMQIGKNGLTDGNIRWLENAFKNRILVKVSVLKSAGHAKEKVIEIAEEIVNRLGNKYNYRIVGFVISIRKWRKPVR